MRANTNLDNADTHVNINTQRVTFPTDFRDSFERSILESADGRREVIRNNRKLTPTEATDERLEELLALPRSVSEASRQALVLYVGGATLVRTSESLAPFGLTGSIVGAMPWVAVLTFVVAASRNPSNLLGLVWRLTVVALGGV
jgi:hypothetical protein